VCGCRGKKGYKLKLTTKAYKLSYEKLKDDDNDEEWWRWDGMIMIYVEPLSSHFFEVTDENTVLLKPTGRRSSFQSKIFPYRSKKLYNYTVIFSRNCS
jgi:hypothetical protein